MRTIELPSVDLLTRYLSYNPETGDLIWIANSGKNRLIGKAAGYVDPRSGRSYVRIEGKRYLTYRVIWKMQTGKDPVGYIDHEDTDPSNGKWENLREANHGQNNSNSKGHSKTGLPKGVIHAPNKSGRFVAGITLNKKRKYLGSFDTPELANAAYLAAAQAAFGKYARG